MRILVLLAIAGAACAAPSIVAPYAVPVAAVPKPAPAHVPVAGFPPVTYISRHHAQDELGQVNYGFSHPGQVKNEVRDALGNVVGSYSYIDADNKPVHVQYTAGFDGFQVKSNNLPVGPGALDAPIPVRDTPEVFSAKQEFVEAYNSAAIAAAAAPDDEVILKAAVDSADAVFTDDDDEEVETATVLGILDDTAFGKDEEPVHESGEELPAVAEIKQASEPVEDETVLLTGKDELEERVAVEDAEVKQAPEPIAKEGTIIETSEAHYTVDGVPDEYADTAPSAEVGGTLAQTVSIEPLEIQPTLEATNGDAFLRTLEISELFSTSENVPVVATDTSEPVPTKADFQVDSTAAAEDAPDFGFDGSVTRSGYFPAVGGSLSPLYTNILPYGAYGAHVPVLLPYTVPSPTRQTSHIVVQTPMPYYRFVPRNYIHPIPYASQFLNYVPVRDC